MSGISQWFAAQGISPFLGGIICGILLLFVFSRLMRGDKADRSLKLSSGTGQPAGRSARAMHGVDLRTDHVSISLDNNGQPLKLSAAESAELLEHLRHGRKVEAIKLVRQATEMDLTGAKQLVDALEASGVAGK